MEGKKVLFPNLAAEMARNGDTLETIAELLGVSTPAVSRRLNGVVSWTIHDIDKICRHYSMSYEELFKGA